MQKLINHLPDSVAACFASDLAKVLQFLPVPSRPCTINPRLNLLSLVLSGGCATTSSQAKIVLRLPSRPYRAPYKPLSSALLCGLTVGNAFNMGVVRGKHIRVQLAKDVMNYLK